jgi:chitinase
VRRLIAPLTALLLTGCSTPVRQPDPSPPKVVGYYPSWGTYARDFQVSDVAAGELTHLLYAFGKVTDGRCAAGDPWADYRKPIDGVPGGNIAQLRKLKAAHPGLKVLWSFGGWTGSAGFTRAARDPAAFAESCRALLQDPRWAGVFDGVDVDWEYPNACGEICDTSGPGALATLLQALRGGGVGLVTAAVPGNAAKLRAADYAAAARQADWLGAMTYDFYGTGKGPGPTAAHSPLIAYPGIPSTAATADTTVRTLRDLGVPAGKILLGVGFYGRGWTGVTSATPGSAATGPAPGTYAAGLEDYQVLSARCPPTGTIGGTSYAACGGQWWSYDTPETIKIKMTYARGNALGGAFAWELSGDTADATLLRAMSSALRS